MSPVSTKNDDFGSLGKLLLGLFVLFCSCNHIVRVCANSAVPTQAPSGLSLGQAGATMITSLDGFRQTIGDTVGKVEFLCPNSVSRVCRKGAYGLKIILGVY